MTTLTHPTLNPRAATESFVAATSAAVTLLILLIWSMGALTAGSPTQVGDSPRPSPQAQAAPRQSVQQVAPTNDSRVAPVPSPKAQMAPPKPVQQDNPAA